MNSRFGKYYESCSKPVVLKCHLYLPLPAVITSSVPHLTHCPSIRCNLSSWNFSTSTDERCARRIPQVCFHTLRDLLYSCEVGLSNISLNSCYQEYGTGTSCMLNQHLTVKQTKFLGMIYGAKYT